MKSKISDLRNSKIFRIAKGIKDQSILAFHSGVFLRLSHEINGFQHIPSRNLSLNERSLRAQCGPITLILHVLIYIKHTYEDWSARIKVS
jgi:hypothetical protein